MKTMKKTVSLLLVLTLLVGLAACAAGPSSTSGPKETSQGTAPSENVTESTAPTVEPSVDPTEPTEPDPTEPTEPEPTEPEPTDPPVETQSPKILVAYFSATGTTKGVAQTAAQVMGADLYEIVPEVPYTAADLNYNDNNSRSTREMNDPNCRPTINGSVSDMGQYDIVFIGYPIWWGDAPRILSTFVESYDFAGKTIVPFCTSGGSGVGSSSRNLERLTAGATWLAGQRLNGGASAENIRIWIDGLGLSIDTKR